MPSEDDHRIPAGRQPYDALNGLRVGGLAGAALGAAATFGAGLGYAWLVVVGAVGGAVVGYWYERRNARRDAASASDDD